MAHRKVGYVKNQYPYSDKSFLEKQIVSVRNVKGRHRGWDVSFHAGLCFYIPPISPVRPKAGMKCRMYGRGDFSPIRGLFLDGIRVYYRTERQQREYLAVQQAKREREKFVQAIRSKDDRERRIRSLPPIFRQRIMQFRKANRKFEVEFEPYELMVCEDAFLIAKTIPDETLLKRFHEADWNTQKAWVPGLNQGHSGNSFGAAVFLAKCYVHDKKLVLQAHGALAPLVGCEEYGCHKTEESSECLN